MLEIAKDTVGRTSTLDVLTTTLVAAGRDGATVINMVDVVSFSASGLGMCFTPLPVLGRTSTGTVIPTISAIISATATLSTILNMAVLLEHFGHLLGGRMF